MWRNSEQTKKKDLKTKRKRKGKKKEKKLMLGKWGEGGEENTETNNFKNMIFWGQTLKNHNQSPESVKEMTYKRQSEWVKKDHHY